MTDFPLSWPKLPRPAAGGGLTGQGAVVPCDGGIGAVRALASYGEGSGNEPPAERHSDIARSNAL